MANMMAPYYRLLAERAASDPSAVADFFVASQLQVRPGVADTQALLARELSSGSDDGARLFRQATNLDRDIERARIDHRTLAAQGIDLEPQHQIGPAATRMPEQGLEAERRPEERRVGTECGSKDSSRWSPYH